MVKGLEDFRDFFCGRSDAYVLIGGAACDIWLSEYNIKSRATKDLDLVLIVESLDAKFSRLFWDYIETRGYSCAVNKAGKLRCYRFKNPSSESAPAMLELFSRTASIIDPGDRHIDRISFGGEPPSLSAILLGEPYYNIVKAFSEERDGLKLLSPAGLIMLKALAFLDLEKRKKAGEPVDEHDIKKHRSDIFRMLLVIDPDLRIDPGVEVRLDLVKFEKDWNLISFDWRAFAKSVSLPEKGLSSSVLYYTDNLIYL